jgi:hypothetical protein
VADTSFGHADYLALEDHEEDFSVLRTPLRSLAGHQGVVIAADWLPGGDQGPILQNHTSAVNLPGKFSFSNLAQNSAPKTANVNSCLGGVVYVCSSIVSACGVMCREIKSRQGTAWQLFRKKKMLMGTYYKQKYSLLRSKLQT